MTSISENKVSQIADQFLASSNENMSFVEYVKNEADNDPGFFRWLFDDDEMDDFAVLGEEDEEEYDEFLEEVKNYFTAELVSMHEDLDLVSVTANRSGFPESVREAVTGFDNYEQVLQLAKKYGLSIVRLHRKDGWQVWSYEEDDRPITVHADELGDDYSEYELMDEQDFMEQEVAPFIGDIASGWDSMEDMKSFVDEKEELFDMIEDLDEDEILIANPNQDYFEVVKKEAVRWSFDTHSYQLALM